MPGIVCQNKACYLYGENHYPFWKEHYPNLNWSYGMFGENLTVEELDETKINIGDTYKVGTALVQVCQPRQPCFKLGIKFQDPGVLKRFIASAYSGIYLRVLEEGKVKKGDVLELMHREGNGLTVSDVFSLLYNSTEDDILQKKVIDDKHLPADLREYIAGRFK